MFFKLKALHMDYSLLKAVLGYLEKYQQEHDSQKLEDFIVWLNGELFAAHPEDAHSTHDELLIAYKMMHIHKALKRKTKGILADTKLASIDEYSFLLHLIHAESFRKMEIIELHNLEAPTGIEIIKRLLKHKFIEEFADPKDKRAKRIKITPAGRAQAETLKPQVDALFAEFVSPLSLHEKIQASSVLNKLMA